MSLREGGRDWWFGMVRRSVLLVVLALVLVLVVAGCGDRGGVSIWVSPSEVTLAPGESQEFTAGVQGARDALVEWSASGGELVASGVTAVFTAPAEVGEYSVTARSVRDRGRSASATVTVEAGEAEGGGVLVRFEGLPDGSVAVLGVGTVGVGASGVRRDLLGPSGEVRLALAPGSYRARVGEAYSAGEGGGVYAVGGESSWVFEVVAGETVEREVVFERIADVAPNVRVLSQAAVQMVEAVEGSSLVFTGRPGELADVAVGDVLVLQFGEGTDVAGVVAGDGVSRSSLWDFDWWREGVITTLEQLLGLADEVAVLVMDVFDEVDGWVVDVVPANLADLVTRVEFAQTIVKDELVLPPSAVWSGKLSGFSGGLVLRDVRVNMTLHARRVLVDVDASVGVPEEYGPLGFPSAECYLGLLSGATGWALRAAAQTLDMRCPLWLVVEVLDVVVEVGEADLDFRTALPAEGLKLAFAYPIAHAKAVAAVVSFDVELGADMPVVTVIANERDWRFSAWYENPAGSEEGGVWLEEPTADPIDVDVSLGDAFGGVSVTLSARTHVSLALTDPSTILQAYVGAGPGVSVSTMSGDPAVVREVWPFGIAAFAEAKAGLRYIWKREPKPVFHGSMSPRWSTDPWWVVGDAKLAFGSVPADVAVFVRELPDGPAERVTSPFHVVRPQRDHEVWVEPVGGATLSPSEASCGFTVLEGSGARVRVDRLAIRGVCDVAVVGPEVPVRVELVPASVTLPVGGTQSFTATVSGVSDASVRWSATCGSVPGSGNPVTYSAPFSVPDSGICRVRATSVADEDAWSEATVTITDTDGDLQPLRSSIAAGVHHSLAILEDGTVMAWGANRYGELGIGNADGPEECWYHDDRFSAPCSMRPVRVPGLEGIVSVAAGWSHSVALDASGAVWTWGWNHYGQIGNGSRTQDSGDVHSPYRVPGLTDVVAIGAGSITTLAVRADGTVWVWGSNRHGQLAMSEDTRDVLAPVQVAGVSSAVGITGGDYHTMVLRADGTVWAWGFYLYLGVGATENVHTPTRVPGLSDVVWLSVDTASYSAYARTRDGRSWWWGWGHNLCHGHPRTEDVEFPTEMGVSEGIVRASLGSIESVCAAVRDDGSVVEWGWDYSDYDEDGGDSVVWRENPVVVPEISGARDVVGSYYHHIAVTEAGDLYTWGVFNTLGWLGTGDQEASAHPVRVDIGRVLVID